MTFVIASVLYGVGFAVLSGRAPGALDAGSPGAIVAFFVLWGLVDTLTGKRPARRL